MARAKRRRTHPVVVVNSRKLSVGQIKTLKDAAEATFQGHYATAAELYRKLDVEIAHGHEQDWLRAKLAEVVALAELRGETIEVSDKPEHKGRVRILSRDGLERLRDAETINAGQYAAGIRYRSKFEMVEVNLRSCMAGAVAGGGSPAGAADRTADAKAQVKAWEGAVFASFRVARDGHDALFALREVAGRGRSLRDLSTSGRRQGVFRDRLGRALDVLGDMLALH